MTRLKVSPNIRQNHCRPNYATLIFLLVSCIAASCERDTKLTIEGGNPPKFAMTGNGFLTSVRVRGPQTQREAEGESRYLYWVIETTGKSGPSRRVERISPVTYGVVPDGFEQIYPERGAAPSLVEGQRYYVRIVTSQANGDDGYFTIQNGKVSFAKYESELPPP